MGRAAFALRNPAAVRALVAVRHPGEFIEQRRLDDQVDRTDLLSARETGYCRDLGAEGSGRGNGCLEVGSTSSPSGSKAMGAVSSIVVDARSGTSGSRTRKITAESTTATWEPPLRRSIRIG